MTQSSPSEYRTLPVCLLALLAAFLLVSTERCARAQAPAETESIRANPSGAIAPPANLTAKDHPNDKGTAIDLTWSLSADDQPGRSPRVVEKYTIYRSLADGTRRELVGDVTYSTDNFTDQSCEAGVEYLYEVRTVDVAEHESEPARIAGPVRAQVQWFDSSRSGFAFIVALVCTSVLIFTMLARSGRALHVREIAGLKAVEEAVGRATEMGRPCLFVPGVMDMNEIATVAGISILSHVSRICAEYDADLVVPTSRSLVMTAARETVQAGYLSAERSDAFNPDRIYYVTDEQFAYVTHLAGYMVREEPAACFYAGVFFAESLILGETGNSIGAIQIAGTSEATQLPFFVAACDYTLIGEELFAASAYLSREPHQLGSLKGQDAGKLIAGVLLVVGCLAATLVAMGPDWLFAKPAAFALAVVRESILGAPIAE
jgi:hypothetical protein